MNSLHIVAEEIDALRELTNIGMGRAGAKLSELFECKVKLFVPNVEIVSQSRILDVIHKFAETSEQLNVVQQEFIGDMAGRSSLIYDGASFTSMVGDLGYEEEDVKSLSVQREVLSELTNVINSASLSGLSEELNLGMHLSQPSILELGTESHHVNESRLTEEDPDSEVVLIDIRLEIEAKNFQCDNIISLTEDGLANLMASLRKLMA